MLGATDSPRSSVVERRFCKPKVAGSTPAAGSVATKLVLVSIFLALACDSIDRVHQRIAISSCVGRGWSAEDCAAARFSGYRLPTRTTPRFE